jgi:hypothetical protein
MFEEWGRWIKHDGKGCPMPMGTHSQAKCRDGSHHEGRTGQCDYGPVNAWLWADGAPQGPGDVMEYRMRRPPAIEALARIAAEPYASPEVVGPDGPVRDGKVKA